MELLRSSILGREFVNFRRKTTLSERIRFSRGIRERGVGTIPIVIDSVDREISLALQYLNDPIMPYRKYGNQLELDIDTTIGQILNHVRIVLIREMDNIDSYLFDLTLGLEDGNLLKTDVTLGEIYKIHRNAEDKILYLMVSKESTMWGYIISIINYLREYFS